MAEFKVSNRYAKSLLELSIEKDKLDDVYKDILQLSKTMEESRELRLMLLSPVIKHGKKKAILNLIFKKKINELTNSFLNILCDKTRENLLESICSEFLRLYNIHLGIQTATVVTAVPLTAGLRKEIETIVKEVSEKKIVNLVEEVNEDIIGGFLLRIGDQQIDDTVKGKLNDVKKQLLA